ncbi:hypothetical protein DVH05_008786 [Phytophthora capsici]|nr:hypothetical protein DVH05_008786 [Phytophthora capsici]
MVTTLEMLRAEREAQEAEEARLPFTEVKGTSIYIESYQPTPQENITLKMCVLTAEAHDKMRRLDLIDHELEPDFEQILAEYKRLDVARRNKFVVQLSLWKNRNLQLNTIDYRPGFSYRFQKVHSLNLLYGNPIGSIQHRQRSNIAPLPTITSNNSTFPPASASTLSQLGNTSASHEATSKQLSGKRKTRNSDANSLPTGSLPKKTRKDCAKSSAAESAGTPRHQKLRCNLLSPHVISFSRY